MKLLPPPRAIVRRVGSDYDCVVWTAAIHPLDQPITLKQTAARPGDVLYAVGLDRVVVECFDDPPVAPWYRSRARSARAAKVTAHIIALDALRATEGWLELEQ